MKGRRSGSRRVRLAELAIRKIRLARNDHPFAGALACPGGLGQGIPGRRLCRVPAPELDSDVLLLFGSPFHHFRGCDRYLSTSRHSACRVGLRQRAILRFGQAKGLKPCGISPIPLPLSPSQYSIVLACFLLTSCLSLLYLLRYSCCTCPSQEPAFFEKTGSSSTHPPLHLGLPTCAARPACTCLPKVAD